MHKIRSMARIIFLRVFAGLISVSMVVLSLVSNGATTYARGSTDQQAERISEQQSSGQTSGESSIVGDVDPTASVSTDTDKIRLIYQGDEDSLTENDEVAAKYGDMYILEYENSNDADQAKKRLDKNGTVDQEEIVRATTDSQPSKEETISTDSINKSIEEADKKDVPDYSGKNVIALIDTGTPIKDDKDAVSFIDDDAMDRNGHAAVMTAAIHETAQDADILYLKALDDKGNGTTASVVAALDYAIKAHVSIINLSLSGKAGENTKILESKIREAVDAGIVVLGAAGNNGADASDYVPANVGGTIIVGACTVDGVKTPTSNYGDAVDWYVSAPSTSIATARATGFYYRDHTIKEQKNVCFKTVKIDQNMDASKEAEMSAADAGGGGGGSGSAGGGYGCSVTWLLHDNNDNGFGWVYTNGGSNGTLNVTAVKNAIINNGHPIYDLGHTPTTTTLIQNSLSQAVKECRSNYKKLYGTEAGFKPRIVGIGFAWLNSQYHDYNETANQTNNSVWNSAWNNINPTLYHNNQSYNKNTKSHNSSVSLTDYATSRLNAYNNIRIIVLDDTEPMPAKGNIKISKSADLTSYDNAGTLSYNSFGTDIGYQSDKTNGDTSGVLNQTGTMITSYGEGSIYGFNVKAPTGLTGTGTLQFRGHHAYEGWDQAFNTSAKAKYDKWYTAGGKEMSVGAVQMLDAAGDANNNPSGSGVQTYAWAPKGGTYADADAGWKSSEWNLKYDSDGYAILYNVSNPKVCLNQYGGKKELTKTTSKVVIYNYDGTDACKWKIERTSDGAYVLRSKADPNYYINVANNKHASSNGLPVQLYNSGKGEASMKADKANRWNFFKVSDNETDLSIPSTDDKLPEGTYYIGHQDYALQALQMKLTGNWADKYDLYYQAYVSGSGWTDWVKNGETAGTTGTEKNVLGYRALIVNKASVTSSALKGAVYTVYSNANCTSSVGTITTDEYGQGELKDLEADKTYYIRETSAPSGFDLDPTVKSVKVNGGETVTVYSAEPPQIGKIHIYKSVNVSNASKAKLIYNSFGTDIGHQGDVNNGAVSGVLNQTGAVQKAYGQGALYGFNIKSPVGLIGSGTIQYRGFYTYEGWDQTFDTSTKAKVEKWYTAGDKTSSIGSSMFLDAADDSKGNPSGSAVQLYGWRPVGSSDDATVKSQRWILKYDSDGYASFYNANNQKVCLNQYGGKNQLKNGAKVIVYTDDGTDACKWKIEKTPDGAYIIRSKINPNFCINVSSNDHASDGNLPVTMYYGTGKTDYPTTSDKGNRWNFFKVSENEKDLSVLSTEDKLPEGEYYIAHQDYSLQRIQMKLTGDWANNYDLYYQAYVSGTGWTDLVKNGEAVGSTSAAKDNENTANDILGYRAYLVDKPNTSTAKAKGAVYTIYSDANCTMPVGTIAVDENGEGEAKVKVGNTYYVKETSAPDGLTLDSAVKTVNVSSSGTYNVYSTDMPVIKALTTTAGMSGFTSGTYQDIEKDSSGHSVYTIKDGTKFVNEKNPPKITDTLHYKGLEKGKNYTVISKLYDKETGEEITLPDGEDTVTSNLIPSSDSGDFTVTFDDVNIYYESLYKERNNNEYPYYRNIVIYEDIIDTNTGNAVVSHKDQTDESQSLYLQIKNPNTSKKTKPLANTGGVGGWMLLVLILLGGIYVGLRNKKDING